MATHFKHYINGRWETGVTLGVSENPSDLADVVGEFARADAAQAESAIRAAADAREAWAHSTPQRRAEVLDFIGSEVLARKDELGALLAREEGKTLPEAIGEAARAGQIFKFFAGEALRIPGEKLASVRPGVEVEVTREPVGVVGLIAPWNFPLAIPAWKIAPALAYGNTVVFKPAELVPGCAWALAEIISRSGLPAGAFNLVLGSGRRVGQTIVESPLVDAISFTGSVPVGEALLATATARRARVQLEMGGKNPQVVLDDADLGQAVELCVQSAFFSTGQRCTASSRLIVTEGIYPKFIDAMQKRMAALKVGDALQAGIDIGPVSSKSQLAQDFDYVAIAQKEGAKLLCGGESLKRDTEGFYMAPALFTDTSADMRINREEVFGPVASIIRVKDYDAALAEANNTPFGLSAGIATTSLKYATHFKRHSQAGMVMVNLPTAGVDYHVPFGGRKGSSYGAREQGRYAQEFFTTVKTAYTLA